MLKITKIFVQIHMETHPQMYRNSSISPNHLIIRTPIIICDNNFRIKSNKSNIIVFATFFFVNQR